MGIGMALDYGGEALGNLAGLAGVVESLRRQGQTDRRIQDYFSPGRQPGTLEAGKGEWLSFDGLSDLSGGDRNSTLFRNALQEGSEIDARILPSLMAGRVFDDNRGVLDNSRQTITGQLNPVRDQIRQSRTAAGAANSDLQERTRSFTNSRVGRVNTLTNDVTNRFRKIAEDPSIFRQDEIDAIIQQQIENNVSNYAGAQTQLEAGAARRGVGRGAADAASLLLADSNRRGNEEAARTFLIENARGRADRQDRANESLGQYGGMLEGLGSQIGLGGLGLENEIMGRGTRENLAYLGMDADISTGISDRLTGVDQDEMTNNLNRAAWLQGLGNMMDETNKFRLGVETGNDGAAAAAAMGIAGMGFQNAAGLQAQRAAARTQAQNQPSDWEKFMGAGGGQALGIAGTAALMPTRPWWMGGQGGGAGGAGGVAGIP